MSINNRPKLGQKGMVSILITIFLMMVISLIVIGFAKIARREQRETLDRQLSTQAFYAAESGVNDSVKKLQSAVAAGAPIATDYTTSCTGSGSFMGDQLVANQNQLNGTNVQYTCLLVDPTPSSLPYPVTDGKGTIVPMTAKAGGTIDGINFEWEDGDPTVTKVTTDCQTTAGTFPPADSWGACSARVLRVDITPIGASLPRSTLMSSTKTIFLQPLKPSTGVVSQDLASIPSGTTVGVKCGVDPATKLCKLALALPASTKYTLRIRSIYGKTLSQNLVITPTNGGNPQEVSGAQAVVDSTGKAADVLRRIQVHVDISGLNGDPIPAFAIASKGTICKRYTVVSNQPLTYEPASGVADVASDCDAN